MYVLVIIELILRKFFFKLRFNEAEDGYYVKIEKAMLLFWKYFYSPQKQFVVPVYLYTTLTLAKTFELLHFIFVLLTSLLEPFL